MWMVFGIVSVLFLAANWFFTMKGSKKRNWAMAGSLALTAFALLMEYRMAVHWVLKEDWAALLDVVPSMFPILAGYVILMTVGNIVPLFLKKKGNQTQV
ncbi:MAG: hypothetical protein PHO41_00610 [Eubacteriales bacterium]|nr:hypothetical protein [Eubacteriales bacterium]